MQIEQRKVSELIPYANNSRTHSDAQVAQIAASIKEFGWTNPILIDGENGIIAGHGRLLAARKLGYDEVPTIELSTLTEAQKKAYVIADNKLALNAGWDDDVLRIELEALQELEFDLEVLGFDSDELKDLFEEDRIQLFETGKGSASLSDQIKLFEKKTYEQGKSLIILTGAITELLVILTYLTLLVTKVPAPGRASILKIVVTEPVGTFNILLST